jgi:hypothetical protein
MNPFVNPTQRGVDLPDGCKDLIDVLQQPWLIQATSRARAERFSASDYSTGTFGHIELNVSRLFMSAAEVRVLTILCAASKERKVVISLICHGAALAVTLFLEDEEIGRESTIRALFAEADAAAVGSTVGASSRLLRFPLPACAIRAAQLTADLLRKGFGLAEGSTLFFYYHETPRA